MTRGCAARHALDVSANRCERDDESSSSSFCGRAVSFDTRASVHAVAALHSRAAVLIRQHHAGREPSSRPWRGLRELVLMTRVEDSGRLLILAVLPAAVAAILLLASSRTAWRSVPHGILIHGHRPDVLVLVAALALLSSAFLLGHVARRWRWIAFASGLCLAGATIALVLAGVEWYVRKHPSLVVPPEIEAIEHSREEAGIGLRTPPGPRRYRWIAPAGNIPWIKQDRATVNAERREVEVAIDRNGFPNVDVPDSADIIAIGDSFTMGVDVTLGERWVDHVSRLTGWTVYNMGVGGVGLSQELELYRRYGTVVAAPAVLLGVYGINDLVDEENYQRFRSSGMSPKEWAYGLAGQVYPRPTLGFLQLIRKQLIAHRLSEFRGLAAPPRDLEPVRARGPAGPTKMSYYPHYQVQAYRVATLGPEAYPPVAAMVASLRTFAEKCRVQGRLLGVLYFPIKQTIYPPSDDEQEEWLAFVQAFVPEAREGDWSRERLVEAGRRVLDGDLQLERHLSEVCNRMGVAFHSVRPELRQAATRSGDLTYYHFDTHWNDKAHAAAGRSVAEWLCHSAGWFDHVAQTGGTSESNVPAE
jgi:hypothetical protein